MGEAGAHACKMIFVFILLMATSNIATSIGNKGKINETPIIGSVNGSYGNPKAGNISASYGNPKVGNNNNGSYGNPIVRSNNGSHVNPKLSGSYPQAPAFREYRPPKRPPHPPRGNNP